MEYSHIRKIEVLTDPSVVNEYLALGWQLLNIYLKSNESQLPNSYSQTANYVLGWPFSLLQEKPLYPESKTKPE